MNSKRISLDALPPSVVRLLARREREAEREREAAALDERWPMSLGVRGIVVTLALEMTGLEVRAEGTVAPITPTAEKPLPRPRDRLAAMRILATCDRLVLEQHKFELAENPSSPDDDEPLTPGAIFETLKVTPEVSGQIWDLMSEHLLDSPFFPRKPAPATGGTDGLSTRGEGQSTPVGETSVAPGAGAPRPADRDGEQPRPYVHVDRGAESRLGLDRPSHVPCDRWPITRQMRGQIIQSALSLCGYAIASNGTLEAIAVAEGMARPKRRIVLGALRILTRFDRLSMMAKKLKRRIKLKPRDAWKKKRDPAPGVTWEFLGLVCDLIEADARQRFEQWRAARAAAATTGAPT